MIRKILTFAFAAFLLSSFLGGVPVRAEVSERFGGLTTIESSTTRAVRYGPYATLRRANEVANYARRLGYNAKIIYGGSLYYGTREYYVDVW